MQVLSHPVHRFAITLFRLIKVISRSRLVRVRFSKPKLMPNTFTMQESARVSLDEHLENVSP
jgi:hypothetical protein